jgi:thiol-disulfide isomerase/thioredoxin
MRMVFAIVVALVVGLWWFYIHGRPAPTRINWAAEQRSGNLTDAHGQPAPATSCPSKRYTFIYFSAGWCMPCHAFTPSLVGFYNQAGAKRNFDLVMVSEDQDQAGLEAYAEEFQMPWIFAKKHSQLAKQLLKTYAGSGIPDLVLIDATGTVVLDSFSGNDYLGPQQVLERFGTL